jgi:hypothetical protein
MSTHFSLEPVEKVFFCQYFIPIAGDFFIERNIRPLFQLNEGRHPSFQIRFTHFRKTTLELLQKTFDSFIDVRRAAKNGSEEREHERKEKRGSGSTWQRCQELALTTLLIDRYGESVAMTSTLAVAPSPLHRVGPVDYFRALHPSTPCPRPTAELPYNDSRRTLGMMSLKCRGFDLHPTLLPEGSYTGATRFRPSANGSPTTPHQTAPNDAAHPPRSTTQSNIDRCPPTSHPAASDPNFALEPTVDLRSLPPQKNFTYATCPLHRKLLVQMEPR